MLAAGFVVRMRLADQTFFPPGKSRMIEQIFFLKESDSIVSQYLITSLTTVPWVSPYQSKYASTHQRQRHRCRTIQRSAPTLFPFHLPSFNRSAFSSPCSPSSSIDFEDVRAPVRTSHKAPALVLDQFGTQLGSTKKRTTA